MGQTSGMAQPITIAFVCYLEHYLLVEDADSKMENYSDVGKRQGNLDWSIREIERFSSEASVPQTQDCDWWKIMKVDPIHLGGLNWGKHIGRQDKQIGGHRVYGFHSC